MNILYITKLNGNPSTGPHYSVPKSIEAQGKIDNVYWFNINKVYSAQWENYNVSFANSTDYKISSISVLPKPFDNPDIIIVEQFYNYPFSKIIYDIQKKKIPYVIVPRCEMTEKAMAQKSFKKRVANFFFFKRMVQKSAAIQYLTKEEAEESKKQWKHNFYVMPNGICVPPFENKNIKRDNLVLSYIGRLDINQKGLDLLLDAIKDLKNLLKNNQVNINLYGPDKNNSVRLINKYINKEQLTDIIRIYPPAFGEKKKEILESTDVFIMTSRFEGHPMGLIEALSYGIPCLITRGTNMLEEVEEFQAGWVSENNLDGIKNAIIKMLNERNEISAKREAAYHLAEKYDWDTIAKETHRELTKILESYHNTNENYT